MLLDYVPYFLMHQTLGMPILSISIVKYRRQSLAWV